MQWVKASASVELKKLLENEMSNLTLFIPSGDDFKEVRLGLITDMQNIWSTVYC